MEAIVYQSKPELLQNILQDIGWYVVCGAQRMLRLNASEYCAHSQRKYGALGKEHSEVQLCKKEVQSARGESFEVITRLARLIMEPMWVSAKPRAKK